MTSETNLFGKIVLLVDSDHKLAEMRARRLRSYGITVHKAGTVQEARVSLGMNRYDLVLLAARENQEEAIVFRREIKRYNPTLRVAFLVGPPRYISFTLGENLISMPHQSSNSTEKLKRRLAS